MNFLKGLHRESDKGYNREAKRGLGWERIRRGGTRLLSLSLTIILLSSCAAKGSEDGTGDTAPQGSGASQAAQDEGTAGEESTQGEDSQEEVQAPVPVVFEGQDTEGNVVTSDIFGQSRLTMINVWGTFCGPCLNEMPDLGELAGEYDTADFQLIGLVSDVQEGADEETMEEVKELITLTGADYTHLLLNRSLYMALLTNVTAVPTTFFLDEDGVLLGIVKGAQKKEVWKEIIDGLLEEM